MSFRGQDADRREWQRAQQKPLYQFNDSGDTIDRMLADEDHDGYSDKNPYGWSVPAQSQPLQHQQGFASKSESPIAHRASPTASFKDMLKNKWRDAVLALSEYHIEEAYRRMKDLLGSCLHEHYEHPDAGLLCANVGILHWHLGEQENARRYLMAAIEQQPGLAIHRFLYGCVCFELEDWNEAWQAFESCLALFPADKQGADSRGLGLDYILWRGHIDFNMRAAEEKCRYDDGLPVGIWRMPGLKMFEPT